MVTIHGTIYSYVVLAILRSRLCGFALTIGVAYLHLGGNSRAHARPSLYPPDEVVAEGTPKTNWAGWLRMGPGESGQPDNQDHN
eukprot:728401-Karenia_brevis.AAC.1